MDELLNKLLQPVSTLMNGVGVSENEKSLYLSSDESSSSEYDEDNEFYN